jgi:cytochrome c556
MICGAVPEGAEGLATLKAMGVKTIVSVDGATPEAELAEALGLHYIHLPISYDSVPAARAKELAQVLANAEGPVYMHCHHGKHRSAAALGSALVLVGKLTPEQAEARMKVSGTSGDYQGLWKSVRDAKPLDAAALQADISKFPSVSKVSGLVALMNELDVVFDNVKSAQGAAWGVPKNHPDLVPQKETKRLANVYGQLKTEPESVAHPADYQQMLEKSIRAAEALDAAVRSGDKATADAQYAIVQKGCKECHKSYRDKR